MVTVAETSVENILEKFYIHFNPFSRFEKKSILEMKIEPPKQEAKQEKGLEKLMADILYEIPKKALETIANLYHTAIKQVEKYVPLLKKKEEKKYHKLPWRDKIEDWGGSRYYRSMANEARYVSPLRLLTRTMAYMWICIVKQVK